MAERRDQSCPRVQGAILQTRCHDNNHPTLSLTLSLALTLPAIRSCSYRCLATSKTAVATRALPLMNRIHSHHTSMISYLPVSGWPQSWNRSSQPLWKHPQLGYVLLTINMLQAEKEEFSHKFKSYVHLVRVLRLIPSNSQPDPSAWRCVGGKFGMDLLTRCTFHITRRVQSLFLLKSPLHHLRLDRKVH